MARIFVLNGHPDPSSERFCAALAEAYIAGARSAGHDTRRLDLGRLEFPLIRSAADSDSGPVAPDAIKVQEALVWADHVVLIFPLWLDDAPALLRGLFEQVFRYRFVHIDCDKNKKALNGKTVHTVVTMGMPAEIFATENGAHCVGSLEKGLFAYAALTPVRCTLIGSIHSLDAAACQSWLAQMQGAGAAGR